MIKRLITISVLLLCLPGFRAEAQSLSIYKKNDLLKRIYNNSDTTYIVNFWATWCKPCVAELPEFERFRQAHLNEPVKVILVSLDFREDLEKRVLPFLRKNTYSSEVILLDESNGNDFIDQICPQWSGAIPATIVTSKNKQKFAFFEKKITFDLLEEELKK
jgi:thiol-disulfide isomerase/thioredoxin